MSKKGLKRLSILLLLVLLSCSKEGIRRGEDPKGLYEEGLALYYRGRYTQAIERFQSIVNRYPLSEYSMEANLLIADSYYYMGDYKKAYSAYSSFANLHPTHPRTPYALFQKGMSAFNDMDTIDREQESTKKALASFEELLSAYPRSSYAEKVKRLIPLCRKRLAQREFYVGSFYLKKKHYRGAIGRFQRILEEYPDSGIADKALFYIGDAYLRMGEKEKAIKAFSDLMDSFPESPYTQRAAKRMRSLKEGRDG